MKNTLSLLVQPKILIFQVFACQCFVEIFTFETISVSMRMFFFCSNIIRPSFRICSRHPYCLTILNFQFGIADSGDML